MLRKAINYIKLYCEGLEVDPRNTDPLERKYEEGSKEVADTILKELESIPAIYGVYEYNPYRKAPDRWEELAISKSPDFIRDIAEALYKLHAGRIDLRFDAPDGIYEIKSVENGEPLKIRSERVND